MKSIYWFRNDLRLIDNPSLNIALEKSDEILFVFIHDIAHEKNCSWGFKKMGNHRKLFLSQGLEGLNEHLGEYDHSLNIYVDDPVNILKKLVKQYEIDTIYCESIKTYNEDKQIESLGAMTINIVPYFHSSLFLENQLPFEINKLPDIFTDFRKAIEYEEIKPNKPSILSKKISNIESIKDNNLVNLSVKANNYNKSSFPITDKNFMGGEKTGFLHLKKYFQSDNPATYKKTRNELIGQNFSTKFSPWLAMGFISARQIFFCLKKYEANVLKNESTYWIFFELLWRDYFRFITIKYGKNLFRRNGVNFSKKNIKYNVYNFKLWTEGKTTNKFINAGMNELNLTGFLSNRMRQIVSSYLINELSCDWKAGAAWFESQLVDYDAYSNQGNWSYIAGAGTDPRGGRFFNVEKQKNTYDPNSIYQSFWG
ncbi:DASH family cryptochrome [Methylophilaceae bacterium]|nr:DASH family cryptochrome [Methylophilaceae bacterium]